MGRGLSELQKSILKIAADRGYVDISAVLVTHYGLIRAARLTNEQRRKAFRSYHREGYPRPEFVEWNVNEGCYDPMFPESQRVATSRTFRRLEKRGLLKDLGYCWKLTESGQHLSQGLS